MLALGAFAVVYGLWYSPPLDRAVGVSEVVLLLLAVDLVLGPLLTFSVYQVGKKSLRFDLVVIVIIQLTAFAYGFWAIADGRPAWLVFNVDRFDVARANELDGRYLKETKLPYRSPSWTGPRWVASVNPSDIEERNRLLLESAEGGPDLPQRPDLYQPLESEAANLRARAQPLDVLNQFNHPDVVRGAISAWPNVDAWLPLMSRVEPMVVLLEKSTLRPVAVVDLKPWH